MRLGVTTPSHKSLKFVYIKDNQLEGPCIHRIGPYHRIGQVRTGSGPKFGLFLCLTDFFFFTRMMYIKE